MAGLGYSSDTRSGFKRCDASTAKVNFTLLCDLAKYFHSKAFIEELEGMQRMIENLGGEVYPDPPEGYPVYFSTDNEKEVPVTPYVLAQQGRVGQLLNAYAQWITNQGFPMHHVFFNNPLPTHHSMGTPNGFCLINWRNILHNMLSSDCVCGGMDMDVHATGSGDQSIFKPNWEGKDEYHHYVDFTSVGIYPKFFKIKSSEQKKNLFCKNDQGQLEALPHACHKSNKGGFYFVYTC